MPFSPNAKRDIQIIFFIGYSLTLTLLLDETHSPGYCVLIGTSMAMIAGLSFWWCYHTFRQPISGILTFVRKVLEEITSWLVIAYAIFLTGILPSAILYWIADKIWGGDAGTFGMLTGFVLSLYWAVKLASFVQKKFLNGRFETPELDKIQHKLDATRSGYTRGRNLLYPFVMMAIGLLIIGVFHWCYTEEPDGGVVAFLPMVFF